MVRVSSSGVGRVESGSGGRGNARRAALWADTGGECVRERVCMQRRGQFVTQVTTVAPRVIVVGRSFRLYCLDMPRLLYGLRDEGALYGQFAKIVFRSEMRCDIYGKQFRACARA